MLGNNFRDPLIGVFHVFFGWVGKTVPPVCNAKLRYVFQIVVPIEIGIFQICHCSHLCRSRNHSVVAHKLHQETEARFCKRVNPYFYRYDAFRFRL